MMSTFYKKVVKLVNNGIDVYADDIDVYLDEYIQSRELDPKKVPSSMWAAAMMYINSFVFKGKDLLRQKHTQNNEPYDLDKVLALVNKYCFMCNDHAQRICIEHFALLSGIDRTTIYSWGNDNRRSGDARAKQVYIRLMEDTLTAADDLLLTKSGVNSIAYRNAVQERYSQYMSKQEEKTAIDTAALERQLGLSGNDLALLPEREPQKEVSKKPWETMDLIEI
jgi:hypothetical protein